MKRLSIRAFENEREIELCQVDTNPELVAKAVAAKTKTLATTFGRKIRVRRYSDIRIVDTIKERS